MAKPRKGKIKLRQKVGLRKKGSGDTRRMEVQPPRNNGAVMKIKMKKRGS